MESKYILKQPHDDDVDVRVSHFLYSVCVCAHTYPNHNVVLDLLLLLLRVIAIIAHELRLQHVTSKSIQTEEGAVQLGVFIWVDTYTIICISALHVSYQTVKNSFT